jgi:hypothetical protein
MSWSPRKRPPARSLDDVLIKVAAAVVIGSLMYGGLRTYRATQAAAASEVGFEQARQQGLAAAAASRLAEQQRLDNQWADERLARTQSSSQPAMYKCRDASGATAIQSWPCDGGAATEWARTYQPRDERTAWEAAQRAADIARHEAEVAQYTRMYGDRPAAVAYSAAPQASVDDSRCANAKAYRDSVYRQVGNNRTYDLIRQLNDFVYEACKRT